MKHQNILVIGGDGFIGSHLVAQLAALGRRITVPARRRERGKHLIMLPTVDVVEADVNDAGQLAALIQGQDAVINLVGILHGDTGIPYGKAFAAAHVDLPKKIIAACQLARVKRILHMSALGADVSGPSMYQRSKADGEHAIFIDPAIAVTCFRPSVVFGREDHFLNLFATLQRWFPFIPLAGANARFQPVYVSDVVTAFVNALDDPETFGKTYELVGPQVYSLAQLVKFAGTASGYPRPILGLPDGLGRLQATMMEFAPGPTLMSRDNFDSMKADNVASGRLPGFEALGIQATPLEQEAPLYLSGQHPRTRYDHLRERHAGN